MTLFSGSEKPVDVPGDHCQSVNIGVMPRAVKGETMTGCQIISAMLRFEAKLVTMPNGCRIWNGAQTKGGRGCYTRKKRCKGKRRSTANSPPYGKFWVGPDKKHTVNAHVFAAYVAGKIPTLRVPDGCHLDHRCEHGTLCVDCTELVPCQVNLQRARQGRIGRLDLPPPSKRKGNKVYNSRPKPVSTRFAVRNIASFPPV